MTDTQQVLNKYVLMGSGVGDMEVESMGRHEGHPLSPQPSLLVRGRSCSGGWVAG